MLGISLEPGLTQLTPLTIRKNLITGEQIGLANTELAQSIYEYAGRSSKSQAFNLEYELENYRNEIAIAGRLEDKSLAEEQIQKVDQAFTLQLKMFIAEYLSSMNEFQYEYKFNHEGKLQSEGWSKSAEYNFEQATKDIGADYFTRQVRQAELDSFRSIQSVLAAVARQNHAPSKVLLQSPAENYPGSPYSFVSCYELVESEDPTTKQIVYMVKVRNRKIFAAQIGGTIDQHLRARNSWLNNGAYIVNESQLPTEEKQYKPALDILSSVVVLPNNADFDSLLEVYEQPKAMLDDETISQKLEEFMPVINKFFEAFKAQSQITPDIEKLFKAMLVKAKVHFDEKGAIENWGEQNVTQIKEGIALDSYISEGLLHDEKLALDAMQKEIQAKLTAQIMDLSIMIAGSCGNVSFTQEIKIGEASISSTINAVSTFMMPGETATYDQLLRPNPVVCSCGCKWYVKNGESGTYKHQCPNPMCNKSQTCAFSTN